MPDLDPINQRVAAVAQVAAALLGGIVAKDGFDAALAKGHEAIEFAQRLGVETQKHLAA